MAMETVLSNPIECLGTGFDFTSDFRLKFAKGKGTGRLVVVDEEKKRTITLPGTAATIFDVSQDISCDKGDRLRFKSDVLQFNQVNSLPLSLSLYIYIYLSIILVHIFEYIF